MPTMGYAKERGKLEKLSTKVTGLTDYNDKNLVVITDIYEQYSHIVRILKNKAVDAFGELFMNYLQQVKECKRVLKQTEQDYERQNAFIKYKESLHSAIEKTIQVTLL